MSKQPTTQTGALWPHIQELIDCGGSISIGDIAPVSCAAIASDERNMLAALRRREGESLTALLRRLDEAIGNALEHDIYTDEING